MRVYNGIPVFVGNLIGYFSGVMTFAVIMERGSIGTRRRRAAQIRFMHAVTALLTTRARTHTHLFVFEVWFGR